jgi:SAM-dependent methyltransferase
MADRWQDRWQESDVPRGATYDHRFESLAAAGMDIHGEAALVDSYAPGSVLDAGCGTGRVAVELSRRGYPVVGVDVDPGMLEAARAKAPDLAWVQGDLTDPRLDFGRIFDVVVMAGNVLIFVPNGSEARVLANAARWLAPSGRLVAGYSLRPGGLGPDEHDDRAARCGLVLEDRWSTWDRRPFGPGDDYAVSVHRRVG